MGAKPIGIIQFRLKQNSSSEGSKISEEIGKGRARRCLADGLSPFKRQQRSNADAYFFRNGFELYWSGYVKTMLIRLEILFQMIYYTHIYSELQASVRGSPADSH